MDAAANEAHPADAAVVRQLTGTFGAEITNIDVARLEPSAAVWMRDLLRTYKVLVLPDQQHVGPPELAAFGRLFGELEVVPHHMHPNFEDEPGVKVLTMDTDIASQIPSDSWHTDGSTRQSTRYLSILQGVDVPEFGRDTMFADMEAAYDFLSPAMRAFLDGLTGIYSWGASVPDAPPLEHPLVFADPQTGRKALYVNRGYTRAIKGLRPDESAALLEFLFSQARFPELQLRVSWRPGTIVIWDNEKTQHALVFDRPYRRVMHRVMVN